MKELVVVLLLLCGYEFVGVQLRLLKSLDDPDATVEDLAKQEGGKIKKMIGYLRALYRHTLRT